MNKRLKMLFAIVNQVKGFIRKITQSFPITCVDCVDEDSLINMNIEGNCYQDGEPTYDNPIEIQSVGERTANILPYPYYDTTKTSNGITYTDNGDGSVSASGTATAQYTSFVLAKNLNLTPGKAYIFNRNYSVAPSPALTMKFIDESGTTIFRATRNSYISVMWEESYVFESFYLSSNLADATIDETIFPMVIEADCTSDNNLLPYPYPTFTQYASSSVTLNGITSTDNGDGTVTLDGTYTGTTMIDIHLFGSPSVPIEFPSGTYVLTGCPSNGASTTYRIIGLVQSADGTNKYFNDIGMGYAFEVPEGGKLWLAIRTGADLGTVSGLTFRPCITKVEYEPQGYKIPIVAETENLFDLSLVNKDLRDTLYSASGVSSWGGGVMLTNNVHTIIRPGKTYTLSYDMECLKLYDGNTASVTTGLSVHSATLGHIFSQSYLRRRMTIGEKVHISVTATIPDNFDEVVATMLLYTGYYKDDAGNIIPADTIRFTNIKIEEADCETEPIVSNMYLKEPLRAVNLSYADKLDVKKGECTRNIKIKQLDKNLDFLWRVLNNVPLITYKLNDAYIPEKYSDMVICSHYLNNRNNAYYGRSNSVFLDTTKYLRIYHEGITTLDEYKELLGDEIIDVAYVLAEPIIEKIIAPNLPTFKHGTTYSIATTVQPSSGTVEYYSTTKGV